LLNLCNSAGNPVVIAGYAEDGRGGALSIKNGRGIQIFSAVTGDSEQGILTLWDANGKKSKTVKP
jgi:hypothetical protein